MSSDSNRAILLVAFGTSYPEAQLSLEDIKNFYEEGFPEVEVRMAFTSDFIRKKLLKRDGFLVESPLTALASLQDDGYSRVVVQSLHIIPGEEFHDLVNVVHGFKGIKSKFGFENLSLSMPLLMDMDDYHHVSQALKSQFNEITVAEGQVQENIREPGDMAIVLMGHGTEHPANSAYSQMSNILAEEYDNVFLGTVEGYPAFEDVLEQVKDSGVSKVRLMPFMIVAGDHASNDMAGPEADSWKSMFEKEGFSTDVYLRGLGHSRKLVDVFIAHTKEAF